jgi:hypothetical protein
VDIRPSPSERTFGPRVWATLTTDGVGGYKSIHWALFVHTLLFGGGVGTVVALSRGDTGTGFKFAALAAVGGIATAVFWVAFLIIWSQKRWDVTDGRDA